MPRIHTASIVNQLHALGFSMPGAQQLISGQMLSDVKDRDHLALFLAGLFEGKAVQAVSEGGRSVMKTQSGITIELDDAAEGGSGGQGGGAAFAKQGAPASSRTASGIKVSFDDDA